MKKTKDKTKKVETYNGPSEYGNVLIIRGEYKGCIGYYDDDEGPNKAVVYLGEPLLSRYILINPKFIVPAGNIQNLATKRLLKRLHPEWADFFDVADKSAK